MQYLEKFDAMNKAIQEACNIDEIKLIRDKAEAFRYTLIQAKVSPKYIRMAEIYKLRAEYKAGELLKEQARRPGEYPRKQTSELMRFAPTLSDMEITYNQSSNWQLISTIPKEDKFENYLQTSKEVTTSGAVNLAKKLQKLQNKGGGEKYPYWLKVYDIWNFSGVDNILGKEYPGNIPAGIVLNTLYYYTEKNDLVVDPMAGGGVTIDCCKYYDRRCLAYDKRPSKKREDIKKNDILLGYPREANNCDLIFLDPPYYKKKEKEYGEASISAKGKKDYLEDFNIIAKKSHEIIKEGGYLAFLMEPFINYQDSSQSIWLYDYIKRFLANSWSIERIYDVPQTSQRYEAWQIARAKKEKIALTLRRELVIFKKWKTRKDN